MTTVSSIRLWPMIFVDFSVNLKPICIQFCKRHYFIRQLLWKTKRPQCRNVLFINLIYGMVISKQCNIFKSFFSGITVVERILAKLYKTLLGIDLEISKKHPLKCAGWHGV